MISNWNQTTESADTLGHLRRHGLKYDREPRNQCEAGSACIRNTANGDRRLLHINLDQHRLGSSGSFAMAFGIVRDIARALAGCRRISRIVKKSQTQRRKVTTALHVAGERIALHNACCAHTGWMEIVHSDRSGVGCGVECSR